MERIETCRPKCKYGRAEDTKKCKRNPRPKKIAARRSKRLSVKKKSKKSKKQMKAKPYRIGKTVNTTREDAKRLEVRNNLDETINFVAASQK